MGCAFFLCQFHAPRRTRKTSCLLTLRDYRIVLSNQDIYDSFVDVQITFHRVRPPSEPCLDRQDLASD